MSVTSLSIDFLQCHPKAFMGDIHFMKSMKDAKTKTNVKFMLCFEIQEIFTTIWYNISDIQSVPYTVFATTVFYVGLLVIQQSRWVCL
jgi:hypothetical protein